MKPFLPLAAALIAISAPFAASAQDDASAGASVDVSKNDLIYASDGKRIGRVHDLETRRDGTLVVRVIYDNRFVSIPVSTLSPGEKGFVSSLSRSEITGGR